MTTQTKPRLTAKQEAFCLFYFSLKNATEAAKKAGYPIKAAYACGYENLNKPQIQARLAEIADRVTPDADKLIASEIERKRIYSRIARTPLNDEDVTPDHVIRAIAGLNKMERIGAVDSGSVNVHVTINEVEVRLNGNG